MAQLKIALLSALILMFLVPTLTPLINASSVNLAPLPTNWLTDDPWGQQVPALNIIHDTTVTYEGLYTLRIDPSQEYESNTAFDTWHTIAGGNHVVISAYVKTNGTHTDDWAGLRLGIDFYNATLSLGGKDASEYYTAGELTGTSSDGYVHWGEDWTYIKCDFIVPTTVNGKAPVYIVPWFQIWCYPNYPTDAYCAWVSNVSFQINPSSTVSNTGAAPSPLMIGYLVPFIVLGCIFLGVLSAMKEYKGRN